MTSAERLRSAAASAPPLPTPVELALIAAPILANNTVSAAMACKSAFGLWEAACAFLQQEQAKRNAHSTDHDE